MESILSFIILVLLGAIIAIPIAKYYWKRKVKKIASQAPTDLKEADPIQENGRKEETGETGERKPRTKVKRRTGTTRSKTKTTKRKRVQVSDASSTGGDSQTVELHKPADV
jgi:hypothetical protein